ncbi:MAG: hypothetical protein AAFY41_05750, partial [Bacteroidota bacterium]
MNNKPFSLLPLVLATFVAMFFLQVTAKAQDTTAPLLKRAVYTEQSVFLFFDEPVEIAINDASDFSILDCNGNKIPADSITDGTIGDGLLQLHFNREFGSPSFTLDYDGANSLVADVSSNALASFSGAMIELFYSDINENSSLDANEVYNTSFNDPRSITFNNDGSRMYVTSPSVSYVAQYDLSAPYDISTASTTDNGRLTTSSQENNPHSMVFTPDGNKLFILGFFTDRIYSYTMTTAYDITTASYDGVGQTFQVRNENTSNFPASMAFNDLGTKLFVFAKDLNEIYEYDLSSPYAVSTAARASVLPIIGNANSIAFNPVGTRLYVGHAGSSSIRQYELDRPFDLSTLNYLGTSEDLSLAGATTDPYDLQVAPNGQVFIINRIQGRVYEFGIPLDDIVLPELTFASSNQNFQISVSFDEPVTVTGLNPSDFILTDASSATFAVTGVSDQNPGDNTITLTTVDLSAIQPPATLTYVNNNNEVKDLACNTLATDNTGVNFVLDITPPTIESIGAVINGGQKGIDVIFNEAIAVSGDASGAFSATDCTGTPFVFGPSEHETGSNKLFLPVNAFDKILGEITLNFISAGSIIDVAGNLANSTSNLVGKGYPYQIGEALLPFNAQRMADGSFDINSESQDMAFNNDGTKLFITNPATNKIDEYSLSIPYVVLRATYLGASEALDVSSLAPSPLAMTFSPNGQQLFVVRGDNDQVVTFNLGNAFDVSTASVSGSPFNVPADLDDIQFSATGDRLFVFSKATDLLTQYNLSVNYDLSTAIFSNTLDLINIDANPQSFSFSDEGTYLYFAGGGNRD